MAFTYICNTETLYAEKWCKTVPLKYSYRSYQYTNLLWQYMVKELVMI